MKLQPHTHTVESSLGSLDTHTKVTTPIVCRCGAGYIQHLKGPIHSGGNMMRILSKLVQRYFGNERRGETCGTLASTTWRIVGWEPSLILLMVAEIGAIKYMSPPCI